MMMLVPLYADYGVEDAFPNLNFDRPVGIYHADDGSNLLFVLEQAGRIYAFENEQNISDTFVFLDDAILADRSFVKITF